MSDYDTGDGGLQPPSERWDCVDLHCHTTASDGLLAPAALVARAAERGVHLLSITEHDSLGSWEEARVAAGIHGVDLVPGIEFSCVWRGMTLHVLGYDFDPYHEVMLAAVTRQQDGRVQRASAIAQRLCKEGLPDLLAAAMVHAGGDVPGRPHFARALMDAGLVTSEAAAFRQYLGAGKTGDVKAFWPELGEVVSWIRSSGGIATIAHPRKYKMTATRLRELIAEFCQLGGAGIEVLTGGQSAGDTGFLVELSRRLALEVSAGSDFHGPGQSWTDLGRVGALPDGLLPVWRRFSRVYQGRPA